ncbi:MAG: MFS transporter [Gemmatimonadetes bacterium]|nr:MFS transporter [Gemmatimonadota bacterium]MBK9548105.1 MFS transporter [Gemmatimonadota bacterium]MBP6442379.1 MFS transporter [Gemmatimonadales bacterium]
MHDPWAALRLPDFRRFLTAHFTTTLGIQIQGVVVAWQMYLDTHDPLALGLIGLAEALPNIATALFAGHVADRMDRRKLALLATITLLACSLALALLAGLTGEAAEHRVLGAYLVIAVSGIARAFLQPARTALAAAMVTREVQANAVTWRSTTWQLGAVVGPALGGILNVWLGAQGSYLVDASLIVVALVALLAIQFRGAPPVAEMAEPIRESLAAGIRFLRGQQVLLGAMTLDLFSVLFGGAVALLPIFAADILHVGAWGLGVLRAAPAVGAVAMSLVLAWRPPMQRAGRALLFAVAWFGLFTIGFGLARTLWLSTLFLVLTGAADMVSVVVRSTLLQLLVPNHLMGRVTSVNQIFVGSSNEIGSFESGLAARLIGAVPAVLLGGGITLAVVGGTWRWAPKLREVGRLDEVGR